MKKFLLFFLIMSTHAFCMNQSNMALDDSQEKQPVWIPIKWRIVPSAQYTLASRIKAVNMVTKTLTTITQRITQLPFDGERKTILIARLEQIISNGLTCKQSIESTSIDPEDYCSQETSLKALADSFLIPFHRSEDELRTQVEVLEQMVHDQNAEGLDAVFAKLEALSLN